jgi:phosphohistidine phosphatase SixA
MTTFYILRHAHKEFGGYYNPTLRHQDEPITAKGKEAAHQLWTFFSDKQISAIYISCYLRTAQTIAHVASQLGIAPVVDERLNELERKCPLESYRRHFLTFGGHFAREGRIFASQKVRPVRRRAVELPSS